MVFGGDFRLRLRALQGSSKIPFLNRASVGFADYEVRRLRLRRGEFPSPEQTPETRQHRDGADSGLGLRRLLRSVGKKGTAHMKLVALEVDVLPPQPG